MLSLVIPDRQARLPTQLLQFLAAESVVHQSTQRNRVAEILYDGHGVAEDGHRCHDEQDVFEDAAEREHDGGGLADLCFDGG